MPKVLCALENASEEINGVKFVQAEDGMLSEDISNEVADYFCQIPGYSLKDDGAAAAAEAKAKAAEEAKAAADAEAKAKADADAKASAFAAAQAASDQAARDAAAAEADKAAADAAKKEADDLAALTVRAAELGIEVKSTWKAARLTAEIKRAEEAKAAA